MQLTINSFRQLFPDKIFSVTFPWFFVKSLTTFKFHDISRFSRQVVTRQVLLTLWNSPTVGQYATYRRRAHVSESCYSKGQLESTSVDWPSGLWSLSNCYSKHRPVTVYLRCRPVYNLASERWSLTGKLSLSCTQPAADQWPLMWVNRPLYVGLTQPFILSG